MKTKLFLYISIFINVFAGCTKEEPDGPQSKRTLLVYMIANNSLSSYAEKNMASMVQAANAQGLNGGNLIVYYAPVGQDPSLVQIKNNARQTVKQYGKQNAADPQVMQSVIDDVSSLYPADSYGLILWSHGTSWIPSDYNAMLRAFGQDGTKWMEIDELAKGLPDHFFDFILFDACYMASVECVYELKDKADYILASPTETMADGWPYKKILPYFFTETAQLEKIAHTFYTHYDAQNGDMRTATVSLTQTAELGSLASIIREITANKTESDLFALDLSAMQKLEFLSKASGGVSPCMLYDLNDFISQLATTEQYARFTACMDKAIIYEAHTPSAYFAALYRSYPIVRSSGLTVYVPQESLPKINDWYKRLQWYKAVYK